MTLPRRAELQQQGDAGDAAAAQPTAIAPPPPPPPAELEAAAPSTPGYGSNGNGNGGTDPVPDIAVIAMIDEICLEIVESLLGLGLGRNDPGASPTEWLVRKGGC